MSRKDLKVEIHELVDSLVGENALEQAKQLLSELAAKQQNQDSSGRGDAYLEYIKNRPMGMTALEQIEYQRKIKPKVNLEDIVGTWPGDETFEEIMEDLRIIRGK